MLVTLSGTVTLVRPPQPANANSPMLVTPSRIAILVRPVQSRKAFLPMLVTLSPSGEVSGITIFISVQVPIPLTKHVPSPLEVNAKTSLSFFSSVSLSTVSGSAVSDTPVSIAPDSVTSVSTVWVSLPLSVKPSVWISSVLVVSVWASLVSSLSLPLSQATKANIATNAKSSAAHFKLFFIFLSSLK